VGLPKTGSSTLAALLGGFRTRHEWDMLRLLDLGLRLRGGELTAEEFKREAGARLFPPRLEFDDATCHHLYADVLVGHYPDARFVLTARDPLGWANSMVDMGLRQRALLAMAAEGRVDLTRAMTHYAGGAWDLELDTCPDPTDVVVELLRAWGEHADRMAAVLPGERTLVLRTERLDDAAPAVAAFLGAPEPSLVPAGRRNRAPARIDHVAGSDRDRVRQAMVQWCASGIDALAPDWTARVAAALDAPDGRPAYQEQWSSYAKSVRPWLGPRG